MASMMLKAVLLLLSLSSALAFNGRRSSVAAAALGGMANNPDTGKPCIWSPSNAGGVSNLAEGKCEQLIPHCAQCSAGFKTCLKCADDGFRWEVVNGACAVVINFDDLCPQKVPEGEFWESVIPDGYRCFNWNHTVSPDVPAGVDDVFVLCYARGSYMYEGANLTCCQQSGFEFGCVSQPGVAYNDWGQKATITAVDDGTFTVVSVQATAAWNDQKAVFTAVGSDGKRVEQRVEVTTTTPTLVEFGAGFANIKAFSFWGDSHVKTVTPLGPVRNRWIALDDLVMM